MSELQNKQKVHILRNPLTVKQLAAQINHSCDLYGVLELSEKELRELLVYYADSHGRKLFGFNGDLNPTLLKIIGKKRRELVGIMLSGYQSRII